MGTDDDSTKFREEACLLLMKSSERINLDNGGMFLRSFIEKKMHLSQIDESKICDLKCTFIFILIMIFLLKVLERQMMMIQFL